MGVERCSYFHSHSQPGEFVLRGSETRSDGRVVVGVDTGCSRTKVDAVSQAACCSWGLVLAKQPSYRHETQRFPGCACDSSMVLTITASTDGEISILYSRDRVLECHQRPNKVVNQKQMQITVDSRTATSAYPSPCPHHPSG